MVYGKEDYDAATTNNNSKNNNYNSLHFPKRLKVYYKTTEPTASKKQLYFLELVILDTATTIATAIPAATITTSTV
jgi:hypothetical protein